jgi:hypothetical protein
MLRQLAIGTLLFAGAASVAHADVFRWVDEHGSVHYSDQWVPGSEVIKTTSKPHPSNGAPEPKRTVTDAPKLTSASSQIAQDSAARAVKQDVTKVREQQCKDAKERYEKSIQARRIYKSGTDKNNPDDRQYLSDEEADAYRLQARKEVQALCGDSALKSSSE